MIPDIDIEDLIPHRGPMRLIGEVMEVSDDTAVTESVVTSDWPLVEGDVVSPIIMVELVAQTVGVCHGRRELETNGTKIGGRGWIVGIKKVDFFQKKIPLNARIFTKIETRFTYDTYLEILGTARLDSDLIGKIVLQVFRPPADQAGNPFAP